MVARKTQTKKNTDRKVLQNMKPTKLKRNVRDSLFCMYYRNPENALDFYRMLHPDEEVSIEDIEYVSTENVLAVSIVNDLGFTIKGKTVIMVEAQSTWTENIVGRCYLYQAKFYYDYFVRRNEELHRKKAAKFPKLELYAAYTGKKNVPEELSMAKTYWGGDTTFLECKVRVIKNVPLHTAHGQYEYFCRMLEEAESKDEMTNEIILGIIDECIEKNVMREFLSLHRQEVLDMMEGYYNEEKCRKAAIDELLEERTEEVTAQVTEKVTAQVTEKVTAQVTEKVTEKVTRENVISLFDSGFSEEQIAVGLKMSKEKVTSILESR